VYYGGVDRGKDAVEGGKGDREGVKVQIVTLLNQHFKIDDLL